MAGSEVTARYVRRAEGPERVMAVQAEHDFFSDPWRLTVRGRTFGPGDPRTSPSSARPSGRRRLGGDPAVIGSSLSLDDQPFTIVGVMPASFQFPYRAGSLLTGVAVEGRTDLWIAVQPAAPAAQPDGRRRWTAASRRRASPPRRAS